MHKKYQEGGYALVSPKTGEVFAFAEDLKKLYKIIEVKNIEDSNKLVMYVPPPSVNLIFDNERQMTIFENLQKEKR